MVSKALGRDNCDRGRSWETRLHRPHRKRFYFHSGNAVVDHSERAPNEKGEAGQPEQDTQLAPQPRQKLGSLKLFIFPSSSRVNIGMVSVPLSQMESPRGANQISKLSNNYADHAVRARCLTRTRECSGHSQSSLGIRAELHLDVLQGYFRRTESNCHTNIIAKFQSNVTAIC